MPVNVWIFLPYISLFSPNSWSLEWFSKAEKNSYISQVGKPILNDVMKDQSENIKQIFKLKLLYF